MVITKCNNIDCPMKDRCHRFLAKDDENNQPYTYWKPNKDGRCFGFWPEKYFGIIRIKKPKGTVR